MECFLLLLSPIVHILASKAALVGKDDVTYSFTPFRRLLTSKRAAMRSNKISTQLNSSCFRSKFITEPLEEFTVLLLCITSRGNGQGLRGNSKQELDYYGKTLRILLQRMTTESMTADQASEPFLHEGFG